eukprot:gene28443-35295_t
MPEQCGFSRGAGGTHPVSCSLLPLHPTGQPHAQPPASLIHLYRENAFAPLHLPICSMSSPPPPRPSEPEAEPRSLRLEDWLTVIVMAALALITFANVLVRYFTNSSFAWTEEISVFLMIALALIAGSAAVARDQHIRIEYFAEGGSALRSKRLSMLGAATVALLFGVIAVLSARVWEAAANQYNFEYRARSYAVPEHEVAQETVLRNYLSDDELAQLAPLFPPRQPALILIGMQSRAIKELFASQAIPVLR